MFVFSFFSKPSQMLPFSSLSLNPCGSSRDFSRGTPLSLKRDDVLHFILVRVAHLVYLARLTGNERRIKFYFDRCYAIGRPESVMKHPWCSARLPGAMCVIIDVVTFLFAGETNKGLIEINRVSGRYRAAAEDEQWAMGNFVQRFYARCVSRYHSDGEFRSGALQNRGTRSLRRSACEVCLT